MELRHLKYFLVLADELHFGRAAKRLFIAQPPLSRQIKNLEEELGVTLFERTKKKVRLTPYGEYLREESQKIITQVDLIKNRLNLMNKGTIGHITIGYIGSVMHSLLPKTLVNLNREYPNINTTLMEIGNDEQVDAIRKGSIDIGFMRTPFDTPDLKTEIIYSDTFSLILPNNHPLVKSKNLSLKDLADEPFISFSRSCGGSELLNALMRLCSRAGFMPKTVHESSQINSIIRLVECNLGYAIVTTSVKSGYNLNVKFFELDHYPERIDLLLAYNPMNLTPVSKNVIDMILNYKYLP
ncbi:MAG: LysR family transcriptional regulator [bacterium]|nr:LysR family transcriptional regulator [bacterium]